MKGAHFSDTADDNIVNIGFFPAAVASATETDLLCDIPDMEAGRFHVALTVKNLGRARSEEGVEFLFIPSITDFRPKSGNIGYMEGAQNILE